MRLVHHHHIYAELLKGQQIVFLFLGRQLFQPLIQIFAENDHLLDRPILAVFALDFMDCIFNIVDLPFQHSNLPLCGDWDFLKLAVRQNHCVIFSGGDFRNVAVAVFGSKILCGGYQKVCVGEKAVELCCPLAYQGIGNYKHRLVDRSQVLEVHPGGN